MHWPLCPSPVVVRHLATGREVGREEDDEKGEEEEVEGEEEAAERQR